MFTFDPATRTLYRGRSEIAVKPGQEWDLLELLAEEPGRVVTYDDIAARLGRGFQEASAHTIIHRLRRALGGKASGLKIRNVRGVGYSLVHGDHPGGAGHAGDGGGEDLPGDDLARRVYLGPYRSLVHELASAYDLHIEKLRNIAGTTRLWFDRELHARGLKVRVDAHVKQLDEFRLAYKHAYRRWYDAAMTEHGSASGPAAPPTEPRPFATVANLVMIRCLCIDDDDRRRVLELAASLRRAIAAPWSSPEDDSIQVDLELEAPLRLAPVNGPGHDADEVRSFRLHASTFDAQKSHLMRQRGLSPRTDWAPGDPIDARSLLAYANTALGASAHFHATAAYQAWDDRGHPPISSRLWLSHILDSARFAGLQTLGDLDDIMRRGFETAVRYRTTPLGSKTFRRGDVTDLLSKALMFGSEGFFATYPSRPETELFQRDLVAI